MNNNISKSLIGLCPRSIWERATKQERVENIKKAIKRYNIADVEVPVEWYEEFAEHIEELKKLNSV